MMYLEDLKKRYKDMCNTLNARAAMLRNELGYGWLDSYGGSIEHLGLKHNKDETIKFYEDAIEILEKQILKQYELWGSIYGRLS